jgi:hypothetical protein
MRSRQTEKRPRRKEAAREMRSASFNFTAAASAHAFASLSACCRINYLQGFENKYRGGTTGGYNPGTSLKVCSEQFGPAALTKVHC